MTQLIKSEIQKNNVAEAVASIVQSVERGDINALQALAALKWYDSVCSAARKEIMQQALKERERHGKEKVMMFGYEIQLMEAGTSYDYSLCGDVAWERMDAEMTALKENIKARETFLKALKAPMVIVDEETGETYKVYPSVKTSTTTLKFS